MHGVRSVKGKAKSAEQFRLECVYADASLFLPFSHSRLFVLSRRYSHSYYFSSVLVTIGTRKREEENGIFAWRENVRNPDVVVRAENIATDVLFGLRYPGRRRSGSDWCAGQEAEREWWIETKRRLRNPVAVAARERKKGTDGSSLQTTLITDSVYGIPGSESDHYREGESGENPICATCRREHEANRLAEVSSPRVLKFVKLVDEHPSWLSATRRRARVGKKFGCARKRSTMLHRMLVPSGKVRQTETARVELCIRELRGNRKGVAATASHYCDSLSTLTKVLKRVMTDPSIKSRHRKNKSRQMTMMMTPVKAQDDSAVAPRRAPQGTASMSR
ncbi:hypothetical protein ALC53_00269 [Atta colombica]|uniref:Uncharacterized protein n=1 Tax=Atta colombica TaxID=520822 RepID=A0A195BXL6_9HYME|nr:hypothetical protein ALC53_00269 [Atta colombica]